MKCPRLLRLRLPQSLIAATLVLAVIPAFAADKPAGKADPLDWPHWRGPEMNGISREKGLIDSWDPDTGENVLWKSEALAGRTTPIVMNGKLYTICRSFPETTQEGEKVVCADAATGEILWENIGNVFLSDAPAERVGWSSVVGDPATGHVYALGLGAYFQCMNGETGETIWSHSMSEEYGMLTTYGGRTNFPTLFENLVIISGVTTGWGDLAVPAHRFVAFDKLTGEAVWIQSTRLRPTDTTFSTPILTVINGEAVFVVGSGDGSVYAIQPRTGKIVWKYNASLRGLNQTPLVVGTTVFSGHSEEDAVDPSVTGSFFAIDATGTGDITKSHKIWSVPEIASGRSAPLLVDDRLYVLTDNAAMYILDPKTGEQIKRQKLGTIMTGSMVYGDGKIYVGEQTGRWYILEPSEKGVNIIHKTRVEGAEIIGSPIISHGRVYLPTNGAMYCLGVKGKAPSADPIPPKPQEDPTEKDAVPAQVLVVPAESLLSPGDKVAFRANLYNAKGRFLKSVPAKYTLEGQGKIDDKGVYSTGKDASHGATIVTASVGELTAQARIRVIPPLPWSFDFSDGQIPITWVGARYRHQFREVEGNPMLVKISTIPLGTRSQCWMGPPELHDYTIQADVKGGINNGKMPDIGLVNQRYTLDMRGLQELQIRSWTPRLELRFAKTIPFEWKPDTWYTLKFQSENKDGKAILRGKAWPRGEPEPKEWAIEAADATPNVIGSPGLFGKSSDAEILIDNVKVYENP